MLLFQTKKSFFETKYHASIHSRVKGSVVRGKCHGDVSVSLWQLTLRPLRPRWTGPLTGEHTRLMHNTLPIPSHAELSGSRSVPVSFRMLRNSPEYASSFCVWGWDGKYGDLWSFLFFFLYFFCLFFFFFTPGERGQYSTLLEQVIGSLWMCSWQCWNLLTLRSVLAIK